MTQPDSTSRSKYNVAVAGAGIAGLTTALALNKLGHSATVFEATPEWAEIGAGITLSPNAMCGLGFVGVADKIIAMGTEPVTQQISHWQSGETLMTVDRTGTSERYGSAYVYIHRADLHRILVAAVEEAGIDIQLGKCAVNADYERELPELQFADGSAVTADLIVAADGLKSRLRQLFSAVESHFTGHIAYRALAPANPEIQGLIDQPGMHIGPGKMIVRYPLRAGALLNLVFFARQDGWSEDGWSIPAEIAELQELYSDWCPEIHQLLKALAPGTLFKWAINAHKPLSDGWTLNDKVTLVGDAAHAMTPFLGQGAATGIEDGVMLARSLSSAHSVKDALERYYASRFERTSFIQKESNDNADRLQGSEAQMYGVGNVRNEESLGLFWYDCVTEPM